MTSIREKTDTTLERDLERVRTAIFAFLGVCAMIGLVLIIVSVAADAVVEGFLAVFVTLGLGALAALGLLGVRMARSVARLKLRSDALRYRIDALEAAFDAQGFDTELPVAPAQHVSQLVSASIPESQYPRLAREKAAVQAANESTRQAARTGVEPGSSPTDRGSSRMIALCKQFEQAIDHEDLSGARAISFRLESLLDPEACEQMRDALVSLDARLRQHLHATFHAALDRDDRHQAIRVGERIIELFPQSRMARDFARIRSALNNSGGEGPRARAGAV